MDELLDLVRSTLAWVRPRERKPMGAVEEPPPLPPPPALVKTPEEPPAAPPETPKATASRFHEMLASAYPEMQFTATADDGLAKEVQARASMSPASKPVWIVCSGKPHPVLLDLERAIHERLAPCALVIGTADGMPEVLVTEEEALHQLWPQATLILLPSPEVMARDPRLKSQVWKKLQAHVRPRPARKRL